MSESQALFPSREIGTTAKHHQFSPPLSSHPFFGFEEIVFWQTKSSLSSLFSTFIGFHFLSNSSSHNIFMCFDDLNLHPSTSSKRFFFSLLLSLHLGHSLSIKAMTVFAFVWSDVEKRAAVFGANFHAIQRVPGMKIRRCIHDKAGRRLLTQPMPTKRAEQALFEKYQPSCRNGQWTKGYSIGAGHRAPHWIFRGFLPVRAVLPGVVTRLPATPPD